MELTSLKINRKTKKRNNRALRGRFIKRLEKMICRFLGKDYVLIGKQLDTTTINKYKVRLNGSNYKSERLVIERLTEFGVTDYFRNMPLLNRFFGDIVFPDLGYVFELDGWSHIKEEQKLKDSRKDMWLNRFGYKVYRLKILNQEDVEYAAEFIFKLVGKKQLKNNSHTRTLILPPVFLRKKSDKVKSIPNVKIKKKRVFRSKYIGYKSIREFKEQERAAIKHALTEYYKAK